MIVRLLIEGVMFSGSNYVDVDLPCIPSPGSVVVDGDFDYTVLHNPPLFKDGVVMIHASRHGTRYPACCGGNRRNAFYRK